MVLALVVAVVITACLILEGLSVTSAVIQLGTFVGAVVCWVAIGRPARPRTTAAVSDAESASGGIRIEQSASASTADRLRAADDIEIVQRHPDR